MESVNGRTVRLERVVDAYARLVELVEAMDRRMPAATEDEDGFITGYRLPVGPWHRILGFVHGEGATALAALTEDDYKRAAGKNAVSE
jgi:hypothetical protein